MATPITAADVKKLRDQTGAGMMECKNALVEANGDFEEAVTILRKRGLASAAKKAGRAANEGLIANTVAPDHSSGILAEVNCESDFVARTPDFVQLMGDVLKEIEKAGDAANDAWLKDPQGPVIKLVAPVIAKLGENMGVPRFVRYAGQGYVGQYVHLGGKIAVMLEFAGVTPEVCGSSMKVRGSTSLKYPDRSRSRDRTRANCFPSAPSLSPPPFFSGDTAIGKDWLPGPKI